MVQDYILSQSIQREIATTDEYSDFELTLCPIYDFCMKLLKLGTKVEVIALLGVKQWEHFTKEVELSLDVLTDIIQLYFKVRTTTFKTLEAMFAYHLIGWSRYPRYKNLVYLYSYYHRHPNGSIQEQELAHYLIALNKMIFVYSINYGKSLTKVHSFMREKAVRRVES